MIQLILDEPTAAIVLMALIIYGVYGTVVVKDLLRKHPPDEAAEEPPHQQ